MVSNEFKYCVDYDYSTSNSCEESGCYDEGICRCGIIEDAIIVTVNIPDIVDRIYGDLRPDNISDQRNIKISEIFSVNESIIDKYCINRILTHLKVYDPYNWHLEIESGYYGQEIGEIKLHEDIFQRAKSLCETVDEMISPLEKIKFILNLEYGYIPEDLEINQIRIINIHKSDIAFKDLSSGHINLVNSKNLSFYSVGKYLLPRGIVKSCQGKYKIIDGYHRIISSKAEKIDVLEVS